MGPRSGKTLTATDGSQGGTQSIWAAGCGEGVTQASSSITGFCDMGKDLAGRLRGGKDFSRRKVSAVMAS